MDTIIQALQSATIAQQMPMAQIAKEVGLGSVAHFTDVFKRIEDVTPYEYRRQHSRKQRKKESAHSSAEQE